MLNTITINDDVNYAINKVVGRKPAKMGEVKVVNLSAKAKKERLKVREARVQPAVAPNDVKVETKVEQPALNNQPQTQTITQPASPVQPEPKVENNVIKFPTVEEYQTRLLNKGVVCFNNVLGNINAKAARKLRVDSKVVKYQDYVTRNVAVKPQPIVKEEVKTFDFSGVLNQPALTVEPPKPSIDDYFKKENSAFAQQPVEEKSKPLAEIVDIEEIRRKTELLNEKNENINKIEL